MEKQYSAADVTIAVLNYNGLKNLPDVFASIKKLDHPPAETIMVDDGSTDSSTDWVRSNHPDVRVVDMGRNTTVLNMVRNTALRAANTDLVLIVDNDVMLRNDCVDEAVKAMNTLPNATVCMTRAVYEEKPDTIYQDGQILHYVGASPNINRECKISDVDSQPRLSIGWGVQLINREKSRAVDWFNEKYYLGWGDDGEFNHKLNMAGLNCYHVPASVVLHKRHGGSKRYAPAVTNRWRFILEMYHWKTLILTAPALLFYELPLFGFLLMKKCPMDYVHGMCRVLKSLPEILVNRRKIQAMRTVPDNKLMTSGDIFVYSDDISSGTLTIGYKTINAILNGYWLLIRDMV